MKNELPTKGDLILLISTVALIIAAIVNNY